MSTNKLSQKFLSILFLVVFFSLLASLFRQILVYYRINKRLTEEQRELQVLEKKSKELKKRLELIKEKGPLVLSPTQAPKEIDFVEPGIPNFEKWRRLFFY